nr:hypothetical protein [Mycobacterium haemophilum]
MTYLARYAATRRGDSRDAVVLAGSFGAAAVSGINGWVSIWVSNRNVRTAAWIGSPSPAAALMRAWRAAFPSAPVAPLRQPPAASRHRD